MASLKVYCVDTNQHIENENYFGDISLFIEESKRQNLVFSLDDFEKAFNHDLVNTSSILIRIV